MSIYCTLWELRFPPDGVMFLSDAEVGTVVFAQAVPSHIQDTGEKWNFLPAPVEDLSPYHRAVIIATPDAIKGTRRNGQEYKSPLLVLTGKEYATMSFDELHDRICDEIRQRYEKKYRSRKRISRVP